MINVSRVAVNVQLNIGDRLLLLLLQFLPAKELVLDTMQTSACCRFVLLYSCKYMHLIKISENLDVDYMAYYDKYIYIYMFCMCAAACA